MKSCVSFIGEYAARTTQLSWDEDLVYRQLLELRAAQVGAVK